MPEDDLGSTQRAMVETWERHTAAEFKSIDATMATMTAEPVVNHVPVPLSRTVGANRIVDELIYKFTHTIEIDAQRLPVTGIESSRKVVDSAQEPSNGLIQRERGP
jgi:hypothetical protein